MKILPVKDYGILGIALSIYNIGLIAQHFGFKNSVIQKTSAAANADEIRTIVSTSIIFRLITSAILGIILIASRNFISLRIFQFPALADCFGLIIAAIALKCVEENFESLLLGLQQYKKYFSLQIFFSLISLGLYIFLVSANKITGFFQALIISTAFRLIIQGVFLFKQIPHLLIIPGLNTFKDMLKNIFSIGSVVYGTKIVNIIWLRSGIIFLGIYSSAEVVGQFNFGLSAAQKLILFSTSLSLVNVPYMTKLFTAHPHTFNRIFQQGFHAFLKFLIPLVIFMTVFSTPLFTLILKEKYSLGYKIFPYFLFAFLLFAAGNYISTAFFFPSNNFQGILKINVISRLTGVIISWWLIFEGFGLSGAALGFLAGMLISFFIFLFRAIKLSGLNMNEYSNAISVLIISLNLLVYYFFPASIQISVPVFTITFILYIAVNYKFIKLFFKNQ
jgi:O-antigen/teichoic acid export membrane protein